MRIVSLRALGAVAIASVAAMVTSSTGCATSAANGGPPDTAHFAGSIAASFCGSLQSCCAAAKIKYDPGSCTAQMQATFQTTVDAVKDGKVVYDPNAVGACEAALANREALCSNDGGAPPGVDAGFIDSITAACWPVFKGTVAPGGECQRAQDCKTPGPTVLATCRNDVRPGADPTKKVCFLTTAHVLPGNECRSQPAQGGFETSSCEATMGTCDTSNAPPSDPSLGTCKAYAAIGDACGGVPAVYCAPTTSTCDFNTKTCAALPGNGEACPSFVCAPGFYCKSTGGGQPTCNAQLPDGSSCMLGGDPRQCASLFCQNVPSSDGGFPTGICSGSTAHGTYDISPRSCGYGPNGTGDEDAGIQPPAGPQSMNDRLWFQDP